MTWKTTSSPLPATYINSAPAHSHPDLPVVSQTQKPATFDPEYDEIAPTMKLDHGDKQPASPANMAAYYNVVASDVVPEPSSGEVGSTLPIYAQPDMSKKHTHMKDLAADPDTAPQVGVFNPGQFQS